MNTTNNMQNEIVFLPTFSGLLKQSILIYKQYFTSYMLLYILCSLPFFLVQLFIHSQLISLLEIAYLPLFSGCVFLSLPTVYSYQSVKPMATLQVIKPFLVLLYSLYLFSNLLIRFIGLTGILAKSSSVLGLVVSLFILALYLFYFFSYYFSLLMNKTKLSEFIHCIKASQNLISKNFYKFIMAFILIYFISHIFDALFFLPYVMSDSVFVKIWQEVSVATQVSPNVQANNQLLTRSMYLFSTPTYLALRYLIHAISLPIIYIFWGLFFLREVNLEDSNVVLRFLHLKVTKDTNTETSI